MQLRFLGGAGTVTGSRFLVTQSDTRIVVDCGLFQGVKVLRERNRAPLPFEPEEIDAVVLTHAHVDHSGYLPVLVREGFGGPVFCSGPTNRLCRILLPDAGHLQEEEARYAQRKGFSKHDPPLPLYTEEDAVRALGHLRSLATREKRSIGDLEVELIPAGHILGACGVLVRGGGTSVYFSGDVGREHDKLTYPPEPPPEADFVVVESTYGDRLHEDHDPVAALGAVTRRTVERGGTLVIPAFAVGRVQAVMYCLDEVFERGLSPRVPAYVNSPMAADVTDLYQGFSEWHRLTLPEVRALCRSFVFVNSVEHSKALNNDRSPKVVVSASGMLAGGRVLHHVRAFGPDPRSTVLFVGYQAEGTRGRALLDGKRSVKVHGAYVDVEAELAEIDGFSAHADQGELLRWLARIPSKPRGVFIVHGETVASDVLRTRIGEDLHMRAKVPEHGYTANLS